MENVDVKQVRKRGRKSICNPYFEEISNLLNMGVSIASAHKIIIATKEIEITYDGFKKWVNTNKENLKSYRR